MVALATLLGALLGRDELILWVQGHPAVEAWATIFMSVALQAMPFLVFGVFLSAAVTVLVPVDRLLAKLPRSPALAVPLAGAAGAVLPGCECASVPLAASLIRRGVPQAPALAFLLAAPAINPVVLVATAVAFPGRPEMVVARFTASLAAAATMGWFWLRLGRPELLRLRPSASQHGRGRASIFVDVMRHDLLHTGGYLVLGAGLAASVNVLVPRTWLPALNQQAVTAVVALAALAVLVAICSEADAFVAASFTQFSPTAMLAFMVVGPMVDLKLIALQVGTFGRGFTSWFAPATFVAATTASAGVGWWLL